MLHGEVKVNHGEIAWWTAVRVDSVENSKPEERYYVYRCSVEYRDMKGYLRKTGPFLVHHKFADGALLLAGKVLAKGQHLFSTQDKEWSKL